MVSASESASIASHRAAAESSVTQKGSRHIGNVGNLPQPLDQIGIELAGRFVDVRRSAKRIPGHPLDFYFAATIPVAALRVRTSVGHGPRKKAVSHLSPPLLSRHVTRQIAALRQNARRVGMMMATRQHGGTAQVDPAQNNSTQISPPWWRGAVIYQVYPRSFADTTGNGIGDLPGITAHLKYIASLGIDAVWISPFFTSPMADYGYDVADYRDVDPMFGTLADFDALLARAHALRLKIIIDLVFSHTSNAHPWFASSGSSAADDKADWYVWADPKPDGSPPNNWQSIFGGPGWTWQATRGQYYFHNFLSQQPQLNVHNPAVQAALIDIMAFWLDRGVDGFRLDAINYAMHDPALTDNPPLSPAIGARTRPFDYQQHVHNQSQPEIPAFLARLRQLTESKGKAFLVGEIGGEWAATEMKAYTADDRHLHSGYSFSFLSIPALGAAHVRDTVGAWPGKPGEGWPSWAFSNHDAPRVASRWLRADGTGPSPALCLALLLSLRGNAFVYQGEELGLPQAVVPFDRLRDPEAIANWPLTLGRDGARTPMPWSGDRPHCGFTTGEPWLPVDARHASLAVDRQEDDPDSTLNIMRRLMALRRQHSALRIGEWTPIDTPPGLLAFDRGSGAAGPVRCIFNLSNQPVPTDLIAGWQPIFSHGDVSGTVMAPWSGVMAVPHA